MRTYYTSTGEEPTSQHSRGPAHPVHFYTVPEAAAAINVGRSFVYRLIASGQLPLVKLGRKSLIPASAITTFAEQASESGRVDPDINELDRGVVR